MKQSSFLQAACACLLIASLVGCSQANWDDMPSWFGGSVAHRTPGTQMPKGDVAPAPDAAPVEPVQAQPVVPTPSSMLYHKVKVGILLPLSGPNAVLGRSMLNAAQQAVFDAAAPNFELMPRDTGTDDATATQAARDAIANGAALLIGPLFAGQVPAVFTVASASAVPVLTLSTDTALAQPGLYVMGFTPAAQAERVARFAVAHGVKRFAALVPANSYGALVGQAFQVEVAKDGGTMVALNTYDPAKHDSEVQIKDLADKANVIDGLFLPEGGGDLAFISKQLSAAGIDGQKIRMMGTGLWDDHGTGATAPYIVGGWYAAPDPAVRQNFIASYKSLYTAEPPRLATLAYDATALAAALAKRGATFDMEALTNKNGFAGLDGIFRLQPNGQVERGLAVLRVTADGSEVIDSAPPSFIGAK